MNGDRGVADQIDVVAGDCAGFIHRDLEDMVRLILVVADQAKNSQRRPIGRLIVGGGGILGQRRRLLIVLIGGGDLLVSVVDLIPLIGDVVAVVIDDRLHIGSPAEERGRTAPRHRMPGVAGPPACRAPSAGMRAVPAAGEGSSAVVRIPDGRPLCGDVSAVERDGRVIGSGRITGSACRGGMRAKSGVGRQGGMIA